MKVFRIEHPDHGLGPFIGPTSRELFSMLAKMVDAGEFPDSKFIMDVSIHDSFAVKTLKELRDWFPDLELVRMFHDEGYHIACYKTKAVDHDDGNQLTFRKSSASLFKTYSLTAFL